MIDVTRHTHRVPGPSRTTSLCDHLPGAAPTLSWLAETQVDALGGLRDLVAEAVRDLTDSGAQVPTARKQLLCEFWEHQLRSRLEGLTGEEYLREPVAGA